MPFSMNYVMNDIAINFLGNKLDDPFLWIGLNCLCARLTRRQFTFYH